MRVARLAAAAAAALAAFVFIEARTRRAAAPAPASSLPAPAPASVPRPGPPASSLPAAALAGLDEVSAPSKIQRGFAFNEFAPGARLLDVTIDGVPAADRVARMHGRCTQAPDQPCGLFRFALPDLTHAHAIRFTADFGPIVSVDRGDYDPLRRCVVWSTEKMVSGYIAKAGTGGCLPVEIEER